MPFSGLLFPIVQLFFSLLEFDFPLRLGLALAPHFLEWHKRHLSAVAAVERTFNPVIVTARDRIIFMVVTTCTSEREAEHGRAGRGNLVVQFVEALACAFLLQQVGRKRSI